MDKHLRSSLTPLSWRPGCDYGPMGLDASTLPDVSGLIVGILGGTGDQGRGLAYRLARAGQHIQIGSRVSDRGVAAAASLAAMPGVRGTVAGGSNERVCRLSDVVIVPGPWEGHSATVAELADSLAGKIVVDCVNPLGFDKQGAFPIVVAEGSAAAQAAALLPDSRVCAAFHHVSAVLLADPEIPTIDLDVL